MKTKIKIIAMSSIPAQPYYKNLLKTDEVSSFITTRYIDGTALTNTENGDWPVHYMKQVHGHHFEMVSNDSETPTCVGEADGIITFQKQILLRVKVADCLPVLAYFPNRAVAAIHSGRASTEGNIVGRMLRYMKNIHAPSPPPIFWLGPCICFDCYQIDRKTDLHYDLRGKVVGQIQEIYPEATILHLDSCTLEDPQWYSFREDKTQERMYAYIGMK